MGPGAFVVIARAAGLLWAVAFVVIGLAADLQLYADGSFFSYAVADRASWGFHWHNIAQRATPHLLTHLPAEAYVALTGEGRAGIAIYGALFFATPLAGLALTWALDTTPARIHFTFAGLSTALLAPLVFGFPTELWLSLALLWPAMASLHSPRSWPWPVPLMLLLALAFTHEGGVLLAVVAVGLLALRGLPDAGLRRALLLLAITLAVWLTVKILLPPDDYFASAYGRSAVGFLDLSALMSPVILLLCGAAAALVLLSIGLARAGAGHPATVAAIVVAAGLIACWLLLDLPVHAAERYTVRTVMLGGLVAFAIAAALLATDSPPWPSKIFSPETWTPFARPAMAALTLVSLVHFAETARFVAAWERYKQALRALGSSEISDPRLGDSRFASAERLGERLNRLSWYSTTHYLSILLAPDWLPKRLVVDPDAGYYWLSCAMATAGEARPSALPKESRRLVRVLSCKHR